MTSFKANVFWASPPKVSPWKSALKLSIKKGSTKIFVVFLKTVHEFKVYEINRAALSGKLRCTSLSCYVMLLSKLHHKINLKDLALRTIGATYFLLFVRECVLFLLCTFHSFFSAVVQKKRKGFSSVQNCLCHFPSYTCVHTLITNPTHEWASGFGEEQREKRQTLSNKQIGIKMESLPFADFLELLS